MPRLDVYLVDSGIFSSRQKAKRAIRSGHVLVNGMSSKPSKLVSAEDDIQITETTFERPKGYFKLRELNQLIDMPIVSSGDLVLDVGCSAGGFLLYLLEKGATVVGIEYSKEFLNELQSIVSIYDCVSILFDDAFKLDCRTLFDEDTFDLLLIDVTTDPKGTIFLIQEFTSLIKSGCRLIAAIKSKNDRELEKQILAELVELGYSSVKFHTLDIKNQEFHIDAIRQ